MTTDSRTEEIRARVEAARGGIIGSNMFARATDDPYWEIIVTVAAYRMILAVPADLAYLLDLVVSERQKAEDYHEEILAAHAERDRYRAENEAIKTAIWDVIDSAINDGPHDIDPKALEALSECVEPTVTTAALDAYAETRAGE